MNSKVQLVSRLRHSLGDLRKVEAQLGPENVRELLERTVRERAVVIPPVDVSPRHGDTRDTLPEEQLLAAGNQGLLKLQQQGGTADLTREEILGLEAVVLFIARPALFVVNGNFTRPPEPWGGLLEQERKAIRGVLQSVGRIDVSFGFGHSSMIGTGFLVAPNVVMTNRHVVEAFSELQQGAWRFLGGMTPSINYQGERDGTTQAGFELVEILGVHDSLDLALLRVSLNAEHGHPAPKPLSLASASLEPPAGRDVYVVGYPATDNQGLTPPKVLQDIFGSVYQVKRLQPGKVMDVDAAQGVFTHDCSTLGGNSGSCVVDLTTRFVIGLHFQGSYRKANHAVALWKLADDPLLRGAGLQFV